MRRPPPELTILPLDTGRIAAAQRSFRPRRSGYRWRDDRRRTHPETPDESIPQDPGNPGLAPRRASGRPSAEGATSSDEDGLTRDEREREETTVSEAIGQRTPRHRADGERETER